jgi:hypothetical protein
MPKPKKEEVTRARTPKKVTPPDIFKNLRQASHPIEEMLPPPRPEVSRIAPTHQTAPVSQTPQPLPETGAGSQPAPVSQVAPTRQTPAGYFRLTNEVTDTVLPTLDVYSQTVLVQLLRLAWGFQSQECRVGLPTLAKRCNISESQARRAARLLIQRGIIEQTGQDFSNPNQHERGTTYKIKLALAPTQQTAPTGRVAPVRQTAPVQQVPNKHTEINNTHNTEPSVGVGSRFSLAECRKYAESLRADGINNPGGYGTRLHRSGEADELIATFLAPIEAAPSVDVSKCPDCRGTGFWEPGGAGKGVAKCKHERLYKTDWLEK